MEGEMRWECESIQIFQSLKATVVTPENFNGYASLRSPDEIMISEEVQAAVARIGKKTRLLVASRRALRAREIDQDLSFRTRLELSYIIGKCAARGEKTKPGILSKLQLAIWRKSLAKAGAES
jgi:hypothetical protein